MDIRNYDTTNETFAGRKLGTFSYLPEMDAERRQQLAAYIVSQGWDPAIEHMEPERSSDGYWDMWKLPMFGETQVERIMEELEACRQEFPGHLVRLLGYDNIRQSQGASVVVYKPNGS